MEIVAKQKKVELSSLLSKLTEGPKFKGTKADDVELHDNKDNYTGVYKNGGPTNVDDKVKVRDLSYLANRKEADVRGVLKDNES